ncbi:hypothetical protein [Winogradskyella sp.]|uniref:hypothetical protein n=1 Tax=Winogradskyella sp. TaxID=1883156 RepID=UPI0026331F21|nr:hypothetical protein [Winogradskyella sp.]
MKLNLKGLISDLKKLILLISILVWVVSCNDYDYTKSPGQFDNEKLYVDHVNEKYSFPLPVVKGKDKLIVQEVSYQDSVVIFKYSMKMELQEGMTRENYLDVASKYLDRLMCTTNYEYRTLMASKLRSRHLIFLKGETDLFFQKAYGPLYQCIYDIKVVPLE